ncbi:MAG: type V CRISPR-associated protein Cas12a/Cpf1 [Bacteroidaceae bacterium]|nr:type V CRISPR-associated protein Cas12a/Cpf1 [Bacteroidaceae bacterium]
MNKFTNLYSVDITLRNSLIPIGETLENMTQRSYIEHDEQRAEAYKLVKGIIDDYHRAFIDSRLAHFELRVNSRGAFDSIEEFATLYNIRRDKKRDKEFTTVKKNLRKAISQQLTKCDAYGRIDKRELIREDLPYFIDSLDISEDEKEEKKKQVEQFAKFATYFSNFHTNRANMYVADEKSTSIAYRLINQNLPVFLDNMKVFAMLKAIGFEDELDAIYSDMEEKLNVQSLDELFQQDYYSMLLTQRQITVYNEVIGGRSEKDGKKVKGLNEYINSHNQDHPTARLPFLRPLYKQILSDRVSMSWLPEAFVSDEEMIHAINIFHQNIHPLLWGPMDDAGEPLKNILSQIDTFDTEHIFITNDSALTNISQRLFGQYNLITDALLKRLSQQTPRKRGRKPESDEAYEERIRKAFKAIKSFSIAEINESLKSYMEEETYKDVSSYFRAMDERNDEHVQQANIFNRIEHAYTEAKPFLNKQRASNSPYNQDDDAIKCIKALLEAYKTLQRFINPLVGSGEESSKDDMFYGEFMPIVEELKNITPLYNKVRNWLTRKPYSTEKFKICFDNSSFLSGWPQDYETKGGYIAEHNGLYYLFINEVRLNENQIGFLCDHPDEDNASRILLDFQKPDYRNIPRFFIRSKGDNFAPAVEKYGLPIASVIDIYDQGRFETEYRSINSDDYYRSLHKLIDYFKLGFTRHESYKHYTFQWKPTNEYNDISQFYHDVEVSCYQLKRIPINWNHLLELVRQGAVYLFQIYNKDFSTQSKGKGTPNLHTLYWRMLFDERNAQNLVYKLNGQAEIFFRHASIKPENKVVHKANRPIENKNPLRKPVKPNSSFPYEITKDKRYTLDHFEFHVPITMNFKSPGINNVNPIVIDKIRKGEITHVIGIDRGERHLLYLSLIDLKGKIIHQMTLNTISNQWAEGKIDTDYQKLLGQKEGNRLEARRNWKTIENIKELKEGYLSQAIHLIAQLMVENKAIVVLEDLNFGFMRGRQKVEKQVYQQFEKMLITKLNYYVDKKKDADALGGLLHALQLTNKFESFEKLGKQSGFLFYVPAWNTSKIDPVTGFVNLLNLHYETREKASLFFSKFERISFNEEKNWFEFVLDYGKFTTKAEGTRTAWTLCTFGERIETFRDPQANHQWGNRIMNLTQAFKDFFRDSNIDIYGNLKDQICSQQKAKFFEQLLHLMKLLLQMRNSKKDSTSPEDDYILSPVADDNGVFYDSRHSSESLPNDADANGAYNIARKGLWIIRQIQSASADERPSLTLSNKEWLHFAQTKPYLND